MQEKIVIDFPKRISNNMKTIEFLSALWDSLKNKKDKHIILNVKATYWIDSNMCAPLGLILEKIKLRNEITFKGAAPKLAKLLTNNRFLAKIEPDNSENYRLPFITYEKFLIKEKEKYELYLLNQIPQFLNFRFSSKDTKDFVRILIEMFINVKMHTQSEMITTSGVYFPSNDQIYFSICNRGVTISKNVKQRKEYIFDNDIEAIEWAVKKNSSTRKNDESGGLGLYITREFVKKHKGTLWIVSGNGYWEEYQDKKNCIEMKNTFPGTMITIKIPLGEYELRQEDESERFKKDTIGEIIVDDLIGEVIWQI